MSCHFGHEKVSLAENEFSNIIKVVDMRRIQMLIDSRQKVQKPEVDKICEWMRGQSALCL